MHTVLILNPNSGVSSLAPQDRHEGTFEQHEEAIVAALRTHDIEPEIWYTTPDDPGSGLAKKAAAEGVDTVIAAGGDGTIHAVASGLIGTKSVLGIIALGTMNNLAHSLGIPDTVEGACAIIAKGETKNIDIGNINNHVFLEVAGIGLEAVLFPAAEEIKSYGLASTIRGVIDGLVSLFSFKPASIKVSFDGHRNRPYRVLQVTVCNSPYYGVHLQVAPNTLMDDGLLDVVIYKNFSKLEFIRHGISITRGKRILEPKITRRKVKTLRITADYPVAIHADGVVHGHTPALISVTPGALSVRVPLQVAEGPNVVDGEKKRRQRSIDKKKEATITTTSTEEKGTVNVN
ncbi:MAG: diacylglycerol kinase family lipid kinase [Ktedonobacteraceae bacterium]